MNLDKEIINIKTRKSYVKSFMSEDEKNSYKDQSGKIDENFLPKETVGNVILNTIAMLPVDNKLEGFYSNAIAQIIFGDEREVELKDKFKNFLSSHLEKAIIRIVKKDNKEEMQGLYAGWIISQVLEEIGEKIEI